ncbi:hypothetical protein F5Y14DRAFT_410467 [Nemania sp. NC0429]|nr:hypothetical protein F5Y14DRAFT_410467 [Nemania sp. NC0429]
MARNKKYYGVRKGRVPGVYDNWESCKEQVEKCANQFRGFETRREAEFFVATGHTLDTQDGREMYDEWQSNNKTPPPVPKVRAEKKKQPQQQQPLTKASKAARGSLTRLPLVKLEALDASQSYFSQVPNFEPDENANFEDEFSRFASSQNMAHGSNEWRRERTNAIRHELIFHYSQPADADEDDEDDNDDGIKREDGADVGLSDEDRKRLKVYQHMCREVDLEPLDTIDGCLANLKSVLVNIPDYIDAKRKNMPIKVWGAHEFDAFQRYTLSSGRRISHQEASRGDGFLAALLQYLRRKDSDDVYKKRRYEAVMAREQCANRVSGESRQIKTEPRNAAVKEEPRSSRGAPKRDVEIISVHGSESDCSSPPRAFEEDRSPSSASSSPGSLSIEEPSYDHGSLKRRMSASPSTRDYKRLRT